MPLLIQKADFEFVVDFSNNIADKKLDFHITDAQLFDLEPVVPAAFYEDLFSLSGRVELDALFDGYVKPFLVCAAFTRYLLWAGRNISQFGIRVNSEDSSQEVSDKVRAELIADIDNKKSYYWSRLTKKLADDNYTYDSIVYNFNSNCETSNGRRTFKIRAL